MNHGLSQSPTGKLSTPTFETFLIVADAEDALSVLSHFPVIDALSQLDHHVRPVGFQKHFENAKGSKFALLPPNSASDAFCHLDSRLLARRSRTRRSIAQPPFPQRLRLLCRSKLQKVATAMLLPPTTRPRPHRLCVCRRQCVPATSSGRPSFSPRRRGRCSPRRRRIDMRVRNAPGVQLPRKRPWLAPCWHLPVALAFPMRRHSTVLAPDWAVRQNGVRKLGGFGRRHRQDVAAVQTKFQKMATYTRPPAHRLLK